jgi:hypothetical protein
MADLVRNSRIAQRVRRWPRRTVITVSVIIVVLAAARIALPFVIKRQINVRLEKIPGYVGHVDSITVSLLRGAYTLDGIAIYKEDNKVREPFFLARQIDFSLAWRELWHRKFVSDIVVDRPQVEFIQSTTKETSTTSDADRRWQEVIKEIFPIDITYLEAKDGVVRYVDRKRAPPVDAFIKNLHILATGLRNRPEEGRGGEFPAQINVDGETLGGGALALSLATEPLAAQPHFHLSFKVQRVNLPALNQSLKAYAGVNVSRGSFELVGEMAGRDGGFQGYMKPFFNNLDFKNEDKHASVGDRLWEKIVAGIAWLVKNKPRDQVATRVPFQGRFGSPTVGMWTTVRNVFRHGFIRAFNPTIEDSIKPDNILPNGQSANGKNVADVKSDAPAKKGKSDANDKTSAGTNETNQAGAPTGRPSTAAPGK